MRPTQAGRLAAQADAAADLQACPFCWEARRTVIRLAPGMHVVQCGICHAQGPVGDTPEAAVQNWTLQDGCVEARCPCCGRHFRRPYRARKRYCTWACAARFYDATTRKQRAAETRQRKQRRAETVMHHDASTASGSMLSSEASR